MFLLRQHRKAAGVRRKHKFTFQYVSIKTHKKRYGTSTRKNLHSNMFLLRLVPDEKISNNHGHLHSNMFLLRQN